MIRTVARIAWSAMVYGLLALIMWLAGNAPAELGVAAVIVSGPFGCLTASQAFRDFGAVSGWWKAWARV